MLQDKRLVPGGGATEIELAKQITSYGEVQLSRVQWLSSCRLNKYVNKLVSAADVSWA